MNRTIILILAILMLARPSPGRQHNPANPVVIASAEALPATPPVSGLQAAGPFSLWLQFTSLFLDVATIGTRTDRPESSCNSRQISGRVCDATGQPILGVEIWFLKAADLGAGLSTYPCAISDEDGRFHVNEVGGQEGYLVLEAQGFRTCREWMDGFSQDVRVALQGLNQTRTYRVSVIDEHGRPVADAPVSLQVLGDPSGVKSYEAKTDAGGEATFVWETPDDNRRIGVFRCDLAGYDLALADARLGGVDPITPNLAWPRDLGPRLVLHPASEERQGTVHDAQGRPIAGAQVYLVSMAQTVGGFRLVNLWEAGDRVCRVLLTETDAHGRFTLRRLSPKDLLGLSVQASGFRPQLVSAAIGPDASGLPDVTLHPAGSTVTIRVVRRDSGKPFNFGNVALVGETCRGVGSIDLHGEVLLESIEPGQYMPSLISNQFREDRRYVCVPQPVVVPPGTDHVAVVEVQEGIPVKGQLLEAGTGQPAKKNKASLTACLAGTKTFVNCADVNDEDGTWELYLPEGAFDLSYSYVVDGLNPHAFTSQQPVTIHIDGRQFPEELIFEVDSDAAIRVHALPSLPGITRP